MTHNTKKFLLVITPSWFSGLATVIIAVLVIGSAYFRSRGDSGIFEEGIQGFQTVFSPPYHQLTDRLAQNSVISNIPLLLFWSVVGAIVYLVAVEVFSSFNKTALLEQTLFYTNVRRENLVTSLLASFAVRLAAVFAWLIYCAVFFKLLLPQAVLAGQTAGVTRLSSHLASLFVALIVLIAAIHIQIVLTRVLLLRVRIFSDGIVD
ncbi:MAG: hypothetical protein QFB87_01265 [Patescibacteria group bacterium]|nr:hypothetical protein [Patescibacteria group bacterium]